MGNGKKLKFGKSENRRGEEWGRKIELLGKKRDGEGVMFCKVRLGGMVRKNTH